MAQLWSTGPALIYAGPWNGGTPISFLGTCTDKPQIEVELLYEDAHNDLSGRVAMDRMYAGKQAQIVLDLDRFNYPPYLALTSGPNFSAALAALPGLAGVPGVDQPLDVGSLELTEGMAYMLYVVFPSAAKAAMGGLGAAGETPGYRFWACTTNDHKVISGTTPHRAILAIDAKRVFTPAASGSAAAGAFILYDFNVVGFLPPIN